MDKILHTVETVNGEINGVVWGTFGLLLLVGTGIIITVLTKFFQVSHIGLWFKHTLGSLFNKDVIKHSKEKGSISPFQALCTALAATVGTGNIAGVAAAIAIGGAGAACSCQKVHMRGWNRNRHLCAGICGAILHWL